MQRLSFIFLIDYTEKLYVINFTIWITGINKSLVLPLR